MAVWLWLLLPALALPLGSAHADNCSDLRNNIAAMDAQSNALPGYLGMRVQLASIYNRLCGSSLAQRNEYWYTIDGKQLGPAYIGDRPANAAYAATPDIAQQCAGASNPGICALALGAAANCKAPSPDVKAACSVLGGYGDPGDTVAATGGDPLPDAQLTIGGKIYDVPDACAQALARAEGGGRTFSVIKACPDDLLAALGQAGGKDPGIDPTDFLNALRPLLNKGFAPPGAGPKGGFDQAFCAQMENNAQICKQRQDNMGPCVPTGNSQQPCAPQNNTNMTGQAGAFGDCYALYSRFAGMCRMNVNQRPQIAAAAAPKGAAPPAAKPPTPAAPSKPACLAGTKPTNDGYCVGSGQTYCGGGMTCGNGMECFPGGTCFYSNGCFPEDVHIGSACFPPGKVYCPNNVSCEPGGSCNAHGGCTYPPGAEPPLLTGPDCGGGRGPSKAGYLCAPDGRAYNPATHKICGSTVCDIRAQCGNNACLSPFHQTKAMRQGSLSP